MSAWSTLSGRVRALFDDPVGQSREEAQHQAALELQTLMEPSRQQLVLNVPGSSSPEEAEAMLNRQAAIELDRPVTVPPTSVVDLRNPPEMGAYPPTEKLSNRVLRLTSRHWAKDKPRPPSEIVAEKSALAEVDFARKPAGTQRCLALLDSRRCFGVFVYGTNQTDDGAAVACPTCGASHNFDRAIGRWVVHDVVEVHRTGAITS